jgi:galactose mutarotase-like enzyme
MHGLLGAYPDWRVHDRGADEDSVRLAATVDAAADPVLLAAFPFPHTLTIAATVRDATLHIATTLRATGTVAVPIAFGFHPYLRLPGVDRCGWEIEVPVRERLLLDDRMLPTGRRAEIHVATGRLGSRTFDDGYTELDAPARFILAGGGRRVTVAFDAGYPCAQIFAPAGEPICFEPMTAPTNALVSGTRHARCAGREFSAASLASGPETAKGAKIAPRILA